jgi:hypothetical protein
VLTAEVPGQKNSDGGLWMLDFPASVNSERYELATPSCVADDFSGEIVAINFNDGLYFSLRGLAYAVWQDLLAGISPQRILDGLATVDVALAAATATFIVELERRGLIRPSALAVVTDKPALSLSLARQGVEPPILEAFDDMADLIGTDPIHEVDEQVGWPVRRESVR